MIAELNREHGVTILLTTHVMEEAEELCGEIALLREGQLVAHQPTGALTRSLGLARPITLTLRQGTLLPADWAGDVAALPGVTAVADHAASSEDGHAAAEAPAGPVLRIESVDLRASTPALLGWMRAHQLPLLSMRAEPVTLTDVFTALAVRQVETAPDRR